MLSLRWKDSRYQQMSCKEQEQNQKRREHIPDAPPDAVRCNEQVVAGVQDDAGADQSDSTGEPQPAVVKDVGHAAADQGAAEDVHCPGGNTTDQQKGKLRGSVFGQIAGIFKGRKADRERKGSVCHLLFLRFKDQIVEEQWEQLHHLFADRRDLDHSRGGVGLIIIHEKAAYVSCEQADRHTRDDKKRKDTLPVFGKKQGQQHGNRDTDENIFNVDHGEPPGTEAAAVQPAWQ